MTFLIVLFFALSLCADPPTPVHFDDFDPLNYKTVPTRDWRAPQYEEQNAAIGYNRAAFEISEAMKVRVDFWKDIYSKYNSYQGVIHDANNIDIIHQVMDFSEINSNENLSEAQKIKRRRKQVKQAKERVKKVLLSLHGVKTSQGLKGERLKKFNQYKHITGRDKFKKAAKKVNLRFQLGQRDRFLQAIYYSGRYIEQMEKIFEAHSLPRELVRLVYVESSFNVEAVSSAGASGLFQLMPRTGRQYLKINRAVDFRNHPLEAARAAARLLKFYYSMLNSWPLAITGYNHGAYGVKKLTRKFRTTDIAELVNSKKNARRFGFASRNFYATFLAALHVEKNAKEIFDQVRWAPQLNYAEVKNKHVTNWKTIVSWFDGDSEMAKLYNPHLTYSVRKGYRLVPAGTRLNIPSGKKSQATKDLAKKIRVALPKYKKYRIRPGDTLSRIAERFGTTTRRLKLMNGIRSSHRIQAGKWIRVPNL